MKTWEEAYKTIEDLDNTLETYGKTIEGYLVGGIAFRYLLEKTRDESERHDYRETNDIDIATDNFIEVFEIANDCGLETGMNGARIPRNKLKGARVLNPEKPDTYIDFITDYPFMDDLQKEREFTVDFNEDFEEITNLNLRVPNPDQLIRAKRKAYNDSVTRSDEARKHDLDDAKLLNNYKEEIFDILKEEGKIPEEYESVNHWPGMESMEIPGDYEKYRGNES